MVAIVFPQLKKREHCWKKKAFQVVETYSNLEHKRRRAVWLAIPFWLTLRLTEYFGYLGEAAVIHMLNFSIFIKMSWWNKYHWLSSCIRAADWLFPWRYFLLAAMYYWYVYGFFSSLCNMMKIIFQQTLLYLEKMGRYWSKGTNFHLSWMWSGYLMYNMVTIVTQNLQENISQVSLSHTHTHTRTHTCTYTHRKLCEVMDLLITLVLVIISQWIHVKTSHQWCRRRGNVGDPGCILGSGRSSGERHGNPLQYSCLKNPMDRGTWWATVHEVANSLTRLRTHTHTKP